MDVDAPKRKLADEDTTACLPPGNVSFTCQILPTSNEKEFGRKQSSTRAVFDPRQDVERRPNIPLLGILLSLPGVIAVVVICAIFRPGLFTSVLALAATPVLIVFGTVAIAIFIDFVRDR